MTGSGAPFSHGAIFYDDLSGFLADTVPFLLEGIAAAEPALVAVEPRKVEAMRAALPDPKGSIHFVNMTDLGRNPGRIISAWADFLAEQPAGQRLRGIGEPVWPGRSPDEIVECQRHESLLNLAFADRAGFVLMCPYDRALLDESVLAEARHSHPVLVQDGETVSSNEYDRGVTPFAGSLTEPTSQVEILDLAEHSLAHVRRWVSDDEFTAGLDPERTADLALAVTEAATNTLRHAGGGGELRRWHQNGHIVCEVHDLGWIHDPMTGRLPVDVEAPSGRGIWLIHQLCDLVQIRSSEAGNVVRMHMAAA